MSLAQEGVYTGSKEPQKHFVVNNDGTIGQATEEEIHQIYGEYERTPNIYDRQAEWVGGSQGVENPHFIDMR